MLRFFVSILFIHVVSLVNAQVAKPKQLKYNHQNAFVDENGVIDSSRIYDLVLPTTEDYFFVRKGKNSYFLSSNGTQEINLSIQNQYLYNKSTTYYKIDKKCGILDTLGHFVTEPIFDGLSKIYGTNLFITNQGNKYGLIRHNGSLVVSCEFESIQLFENRLLKYVQNGRIGFMDLTGKILTPAVYESATNTLLGKIIVSKNWLKGVLNWQCVEVVPPMYDDLTQSLGFIYKKNQKFGILDSIGNTITSADYDQINGTGNKGYIVRKRDKIGMLSYSGVVIFPLIYDWIHQLNNSLFFVKLNGERKLVNIKNEIIYTLDPDCYDYVHFDKSLKSFLTMKGGKYGLTDTQNFEILPHIYDFISSFNDSILIVEKNRTQAFYNIYTKTLSDFAYKSITPLENGLFRFEQNNLQGLLDSNCNVLIKPKYNEINKYNNNFLLALKFSVVTKSGNDEISGFDVIHHVEENTHQNSNGSTTYTLLDKLGQEVPNTRFTSILNKSKNGWLVYHNRKSSFIGSNGDIIVPLQFDKVEELSNRFLKVYTNAKIGIWSNNKEIIPCIYDKIESYSNGLFLVLKDKKYFYLNELNQKITLSVEEAIQKLSLSTVVLKKYTGFGLPNEEKNLIRVCNLEGKWGWVDFEGHEVIPCRFELSTPFKNGRAKVKTLLFPKEIEINAKGEYILNQ
jgi:WG containing repeat